MRIPLERRLKRRIHVETALLQDELMEVLYGMDSKLVLHGGTAIWRCYSGNRFSEDLDLYSRNVEKIELELKQKLETRSLKIKKFKKTSNLVFCKVSDASTEVRVEINYSATKTEVVRPYEKTDGSFMDVLTLSAEDLILEKISAYKHRLFVRDIYDIYHLTNYIENEEKIMEQVADLLSSMVKPVDEKNLTAIVYSGTVPTFGQIVEFLWSRFG